MREANFIKQNIEKWKKYELQSTTMQELSLDELTDIYTDVTSDLSYAQTHYPLSRVTDYLEALSLKVHRGVYERPTSSRGSIFHFFSHEVPLAVYDARRSLLVSFLVFVVAIVIGVVSTMGDIDFARTILGDEYVNMTVRNISLGNPVAVYQTGTGTESFLSIAYNNIRVALLTFAMGIFTCLGSAFLVLYNGIMCGTFFSFFDHYGVLGEASLGILQHGTIELCTIVIDGCAGIVMGNGWLFPGTYSRLTSFKRSARQGFKILLGNTPFIIAAAIIEGYFTRYTATPTPVRVLVIVVSLMLMLFYFVYLPIVRYHQSVKEQQHSAS